MMQKIIVYSRSNTEDFIYEKDIGYYKYVDVMFSSKKITKGFTKDDFMLYLAEVVDKYVDDEFDKTCITIYDNKSCVSFVNEGEGLVYHNEKLETKTDGAKELLSRYVVRMYKELPNN